MRYFVIDSFTDTLFKGTPAGVCILERELDAATMQTCQTAIKNIKLRNPFMKKLFVMIPMILIILALAACGENNDIHDTEAQETPCQPISQNEITPDDTTTPEPTPEPEAASVQPNTWTIEELGATIVAAGTFWEDWWIGRRWFSPENYLSYEWWNWEPMPEHYVTFSPEHNAWIERQNAYIDEWNAKFPEGLLDNRAFNILLPSSGFTSLDDIREYLLQYYTEAWVDAKLFSDFPIFVEYDGVLFVDVARACSLRPIWETASHILLETGSLPDEGILVVETTVGYREPWGPLGVTSTVYLATYRFTFIHSKINSVTELCPCGEHYRHEQLRQPTPPINIHEIFAPWLGDWDEDFPQEEHDANIANFVWRFENIHMVTYTQFETDWYGTIILWTDEPLRDFSFVSLDVAGHDWDEDGQLVIDTREVILTIPKLLPTDVVVLNIAFAHYLLPHGAIIFTDEHGIRKRMFIQESMRGGCFPLYHLGLSHNYE